MAESVPVRCPACRREHLYAAPSYPCVCGAPVTPSLDPDAGPVSVTHRTWDEDWVTVRCDACGRAHEWPHPELACPCGTALRIPVTPAVRDGDTGGPARAEGDSDSGGGGGGGADTGTGAGTDAGNGTDAGTGTGVGAGAGTGSETDTGADTGTGASSSTGTGTSASSGTGTGAGTSTSPNARPRGGTTTGAGTGTGTGMGRTVSSAAASGSSDRVRRGPLPRVAARARRAAFQPVTIRTARDAVTAAALYLRWLGYEDIRRADQRPPTGIGIAARGVVAQVDPTVRPASVRDVECLWLTAMTESAECVYFSLAGFADDARDRADHLRVPLFVLDLTGTPQPVNRSADELVAARP